MSRRHSPAVAGTLLLTAFLATGCPGNTTTPPTPSPKPSTGASSKASPTAAPSALATIGTPTQPTATPSGAAAQPTATPSTSTSPTGTTSPAASPSTAVSTAPTTTTMLYYAADLPLTNNTGAGGAAVGTLAADGKSLKVGVWAAGTTGDITDSHLHQGAEGVAGAVVKTLLVDATTKRSATGTWTMGDATEPMTAAHLAALKKGEIYAAIHTAANAAGESRGNLKAFSWAGAADLRPVAGATNATGAMGVGWLTMAADKTATIKVYTAGLTGDITGAHVHKGGPTETGEIVKTLTIGADKKTATGTWAFGSGAEMLTDALIADLKVGKAYLAVHTTQNAGGEIRGQLLAP